MRRMLSQGEIDALLVAATGRGDTGQDDIDEQHVTPYNFRRPDRVSKEQLRSLHFMHDRFSVNISSSLSAFLRAMTEVSIISVEQFAYSEFLMSLPDPTAFYAFTMAPLDGMGAFEINPSIAFTMVDRMLGGTGTTAAPHRAMTEIEQNVLDAITKLVLEHLTEAWRAVTDVTFRMHARETRPQMLRVTGPNEVVILLVFEIRMGESRGMTSICFPAAAIETMAETMTEGWERTRRQPSAAEQARLHANIGRVPVPVTTLLESTLSARELLALQPGDVLSLGRAAAEPVDVHVGQLPRFLGRLALNGAHGAVRLERGINDEAEAGGIA